MQNIIKPDWPAPPNIIAFTTTRQEGFSQQPYHSFNLAQHVGDNPQHVLKNREQLKNSFEWNAEPLWLEQIHSNKIISAEDYPANKIVDGCYALKPQQICTVMTADCLPILLTNRQGNFVMALHAGWRGLANGIIENGIEIAKKYSNDILVWLGPAIHQQQYEIGPEIKEIFMQKNPQFENAFTPSNNDKWLLDLYAIAKQQFNNLGITAIYDNQLCTYQREDLFYSYRREGETGRMATFIYIEY